MACETCYVLIEALKQANQNIESFRDIAKQYEGLYESSRKDCDAATKMLNTLIETVNTHLKGKNW